MIENAEALQKFQTAWRCLLFLWCVFGAVFIPGTAEAALTVDPALTLAAGDHARAIHRDPSSARREAVKASLRKHGVTDAQFLVFAARGTPAAVNKAQKAYERDVLPGHGMTHMGAAWADPNHPALRVVVYTRRLVALAPLPSKLPKNRPLVVRGRSSRPVRAYVLGPCDNDPDCAGLARRVLDQGKGAFQFEVPAADSPVVVEIEVTTERGPEAAVDWMFGGASRPPPPVIKNKTAWLQALGAARARFDVGPLTEDPGLSAAAQKQAEAVCKRGSAAHVLPGGGSPSKRGLAAGHPHVAENVAIAQNPGRLHQNLMWSASHRIARLAATAQSIGIGLVERPAKPGLHARWCVVELVSNLAPSPPTR